MSKKIVVLGGGYAGVLTAKHLAKKLKKQVKANEVEISLIDKNPYNTMLTELHEVACCRVEEESIKMNLKQIFEGRNVNVVLDDIKNMDFDANKLVGENSSYEYDYLVVGSGSKPTYFGTKGAKENSFSLWSFDDAVKLKEHFLATFRKAEATVNADERKKLLTFVVVGGGFTGVEMIGELAEWLPELCRQYHIDKEEVTMTVVDMMPRICMTLPEKVAAKAEKRMLKMGINFAYNSKVIEVGEDFIITSKDDVESKISSNTIIWAAGVEGSDIVKESGKASEASRGNRIETNEYLQYVGRENVYVVGDNLFFTPEGEEHPVPQMVENAEHSSSTAAKNIVVDITGSGEKHAYKPAFHGMMVCIGGRYGVCYVGTHNKKFSMPSFLAMFSKHFINIVYFLQVMGWTKVWNYLQHEVFRIGHNRSFVGGHFANYQPTFWSVPLRLFLGLMWFSEGIVKLEKMISDPKNVFIFTIPAEQLPDGVTSASPWVAESVLPEIFHTIEGFALTGAGLPIPEFMQPFVDWSMNTFIIPIAPLFQGCMIVAEVIVGLLLIAGLFTSIAAMVAAVMCIMIYMSGMASKEIIWYFTGSIALISIGGTGHSFSFDYYVLPWAKKIWKKIPFVRKWYIYNE
ncbi:MAG: FAD-dependent oxidoreductase [Lachnospirales bacterium]